MSEGISVDEWQAEMNRLISESKIRKSWTEEEIRIVRYGYGKVMAKDILVLLNKENAKVCREPRSLCAMNNYIREHKHEWEEDDVRGS